MGDKVHVVLELWDQNKEVWVPAEGKKAKGVNKRPSWGWMRGSAQPRGAQRAAAVIVRGSLGGREAGDAEARLVEAPPSSLH